MFSHCAAMTHEKALAIEEEKTSTHGVENRLMNMFKRYEKKQKKKLENGELKLLVERKKKTM